MLSLVLEARSSSEPLPWLHGESGAGRSMTPTRMTSTIPTARSRQSQAVPVVPTPSSPPLINTTTLGVLTLHRISDPSAAKGQSGHMDSIERYQQVLKSVQHRHRASWRSFASLVGGSWAWTSQFAKDVKHIGSDAR